MIDKETMAKALLLTFAELGVSIDNLQEGENHISVWISVPERSYHCNAKNEEMSGLVLAKRIKEAFLEDMGVKNATVMYRVRKGEHWTAEKAQESMEATKKELYGF